MSVTTASARTRPGAREGMLAFVWASWRGMSQRYVHLALVIGLLLALSRGFGEIMTLRGIWWVNFLDGFTPMAVHALTLLLALAVAVRITPARLPHWVPFAVAAAVATLVAAAVDWGAGLVVKRITDSRGTPGAGDVLAYATGELPTMLLVGVLVAFGCSYVIDTGRRTEALRHLQLERARVTRKAYEARLQALQARVDPRFLFDTLTDIEALYETDAIEAERMLDDLIVYLRAALPGLEETSSTLGAEIMLARTLLDIARIRSRGRLNFALPEAERLADARMPPMLLVPLVQHAIEHAGTNAIAGRAVYVSATPADERLRVAVIGPASAFSPGGDAPVIRAVRERLAALYGKQAQLVEESLEHDLSRGTLEIPYERTERHPR